MRHRRIAWTNGAVWSIELASEYWTSGGESIKLSSTGDGKYAIIQSQPDDNVTIVDTMLLLCDKVILRSMQGTLRSNVIQWDNGDLWLASVAFWPNHGSKGEVAGGKEEEADVADARVGDFWRRFGHRS